MKKITFLYLCAFMVGFITLPISNGEESIFTAIVCGCLIGLVGLPHGAIDHILYSSLALKNMYIFYFIYLSLMVSYVVLWYMFPVVAMVIFLIISAYHFGESQLSNIKQNKIAAMLHYFIWGMHLLSTYITYQYDVLLTLLGENQMKQFVGLLGTKEDQSILLYVSGIVLLGFFVQLFLRSKMSLQQIMQEVYVLFLIHISFYLFGPLVGFTLYFVFLHSMKVIQDEYHYLKDKMSKLSIQKFVKLFIPFSILSLIGLVLIGLLNYCVIDLPIIYLAIILTSVITLPHTFVMHLFYDQE